MQGLLAAFPALLPRGAGRNPALLGLQQLPGAANAALTKGLTLLACDTGDAWGNGAQLHGMLVPAPEDLLLAPGFSVAISTMGWITCPLATLTSIPTLTGNPSEFSDFLPPERLRLSFSKPRACKLVAGLSPKSKGTEPTSSALAVGWLDLDRPVHLKGEKRRQLLGTPSKPPQEPSPSQDLQRG